MTDRSLSCGAAGVLSSMAPIETSARGLPTRCASGLGDSRRGTSTRGAGAPAVGAAGWFAADVMAGVAARAPSRRPGSDTAGAVVSALANFAEYASAPAATIANATVRRWGRLGRGEFMAAILQLR